MRRERMNPNGVKCLKKKKRNGSVKESDDAHQVKPLSSLTTRDQEHGQKANRVFKLKYFDETPPCLCISRQMIMVVITFSHVIKWQHFKRSIFSINICWCQALLHLFIQFYDYLSLISPTNPPQSSLCIVPNRDWGERQHSDVKFWPHKWPRSEITEFHVEIGAFVNGVRQQLCACLILTPRFPPSLHPR